MTRPRPLTRFAGSPLGALVLLVVYAAVVAGWYQGLDVPWWLAVGAVAAAFRTLAAVVGMRRYKAWLAEWQAMGAHDDAPPLPKKKRAWKLVAGALPLLVAIPAYLGAIKRDHEAIPNEVALALVVLWGVACLYVAWKLLRPVWRGVKWLSARRATRRRAKAEAAPVAWLVGRASSSPSRASAQRNLPEYCARLIKESIDTAERGRSRG